MLLKEGLVLYNMLVVHGTYIWTSFCDHLNGHIQFRKMGPRGMLIEQKDIAINV